MFSRISTASLVVLSTFAVLAAATPWGAPAPVTTTVTETAPGPTVTTEPATQCSTGDLQCCNSVQSANSVAVASIIALLGVVIQDPTVLVGLTCSPISAVGLGANSCSAQSVCCENNSFNGVIAVGCTPVNLNL